MKKAKTSITLIVLIILIIFSCNFIRKSLASETAISLYNQLIQSTSVEEMYGILLSNQSVATELSVEEIKSLKSHAEDIYLQNGDPTNEYEDLTDTLSYLAGELKSEDTEVMAELTTGTYNWTTGSQGAITIPTGSNVVINLSGTITMTGCITIAKDATLTVNGTGKIIRGSGYLGQIFDIYSTGFLVIEGNSTANGIVIDGNSSLGQEGEATLIRADNDLTLKNVTLQNNHTDRYRDEEDEEDLTSNSEDTYSGGAITILNHDNRVDIDNCIINNCKAESGGGIYFCRLGYGDISITNTTISNCEATSNDRGGGAIFIDGKLKTGEIVEDANIANYTINMLNVTIDSCKARAGSVMYMHNKGISKIIMNDCTIKKCEAKSGGGAIKTDGNSNYQLTISGGKMCENSSAGSGGAIYWNAAGTYSNLIVKDNVQIYNNTATNQGGGLFVEGKNMEIQSANIYNNKASMGGGIGIKTFANAAYKDGNWSASDSFNLTLSEDVTVSGNIATEAGGGICFNIVDGVPEDGFTFNYTNAGAIIENNIVSSDGGTTIDGIGGAIAIIDATTTNTYNVKTNVESGEIRNNKAAEGGAIHSIIGDFVMSGGTIEEHNVSGNGGAVYISGGSFTMTGGEIKNNTALNGAGTYVIGGSFNIEGGNVTNNIALNNGGAAYVSGGNFTMSDGDITYNEALNGGAVYVNNGEANVIYGNISNNKANNGGAVYVNNGEANVIYGNISNNKANNGGALYIVGGNFVMPSGNMTYNTASNEGGAVYADGGSIVIGIQDCTDENNKHTSSNTHPNVANNTAVYGGGGFMTDGTLTMYCGVLKGNSSNNEGTGNNIYMNGGTLNLDGGTIGEETNPGVVLVGGELNDTREEESEEKKITMVYHSCLENIANHEVSVTDGKYVNVPAAQTGWTKTGYTMVGWTTSENTIVRTFEDYKSVGMAVKVEDTDGDGKIDYYAVWAKTPGIITYELDDGTVNGNNVTSYNYSVTSESIHLLSPEKSYYTFIGWELTASDETITNWETYYPENETSVFYEVSDPANGLDLNIGTHFGDITLTAVYEQKTSNLEIIIKNSDAKNQSYIFEISGEPSNGNDFKPLKVAVVCDEEGNGNVIIKNIPVGEYTVNSRNNWTWRYELSTEDIESATNVVIDNSKETHTITLDEINSKNNFWLNAYNHYIRKEND